MSPPPTSPANRNLDARTVEGFGEEWTTFKQNEVAPAELARIFAAYFKHFPFESLAPAAQGFDLGCGSGRWAALAAPRVGHLHCIDASAAALEVARSRLAGTPNATFHHASVDAIPLPDGSQDFGYSLGVLHHVPDTAAGIRSCVAKLKPGAPFLLYLYYRFDNRPAWFRLLWGMSDIFRQGIARLPFKLRVGVTNVIAALVYWPLARLSRLAAKRGMNVEAWPLSAYRDRSFYTMRTDALDRFGTRLEQRFTRAEMTAMMEAAGLERVRFNETEAFWTAVGWKAGPTRPADKA